MHGYELEVMAIIKCLEKLLCYVLGIHFEIFTDCQAFQKTMTKNNATAKVARWALDKYWRTIFLQISDIVKSEILRNFIYKLTTMDP